MRYGTLAGVQILRLDEAEQIATYTCDKKCGAIIGRFMQRARRFSTSTVSEEFHQNLASLLCF